MKFLASFRSSKYFFAAVIVVALVAYSFVVYGAQLANGVLPPIGGYAAGDSILDPGCAPGTTDCFQNVGFVYPANQVVFGDGSTAGGITDPNFTWDTVNQNFQVGGGSDTSVIQAGNSGLLQGISQMGDTQGNGNSTFLQVIDGNQAINAYAQGSFNILSPIGSNSYFNAQYNSGNPIVGFGDLNSIGNATALITGNATTLILDDSQQTITGQTTGQVYLGDYENNNNGTAFTVDDKRQVIDANVNGGNFEVSGFSASGDSGGRGNYFDVDTAAGSELSVFRTGMSYKTNYVSRETDLVADEYYIDVNTNKDPATEYLPSASGSGHSNSSIGETYVITDYYGNAATNNITIVPNGGDTINGASSYVINADYGSVTLHSDGRGKWIVTSGNAGGGAGGSVAGSNGQVQYNNNGALGADAGLTYDNTAPKLSVSGNGTPNVTSPSFVGSGLNDMTADVSSYDNAYANLNFTITIDSVGNPDTFSWSDNQGDSGSGVAITAGSPQALAHGVAVTFASGSGHTVNNQWAFDAQSNPTILGLTFDGTGTNDFSAYGGSYTGTGTTNYTVTIDSLDAHFTGISNVVGTFTPGETIDDTTSGATGTLLATDEFGPDEVFFSTTAGTFSQSDAIVGESSGATATLSNRPDTADTYTYTDGTTTQQYQFPAQGSGTLSNGVIINFNSQTGHTLGDQWTFSAAQVPEESNFSFNGLGQNDMSVDGSGYDNAYSNISYTVTIDGANNPDTFSWADNQGGGDSGIAITGSPQALSHGVTVSFASTTGHTVGNEWTFNIGQTVLGTVNAGSELDITGNLFATENTHDSVFLGQGVAVNSTVQGSIFEGYGAGTSATSANVSNFIGGLAGYDAINADHSNFIGDQAGGEATNASDSNMIGNDAGTYATYASDSDFMGNSAGSGARNAAQSNFVGSNAGTNATNATQSDFVGLNVGYGATNANNSIFIGLNAGYNDTVDNSSGGTSILIGDNTSTGGFSNSIALGAGGTNTMSNQFLVASAYTNWDIAGVDYAWPSSQAPAAGDVLTNDGSGNLSWAPADTEGIDDVLAQNQGLAASRSIDLDQGTNYHLTPSQHRSLTITSNRYADGYFGVDESGSGPTVAFLGDYHNDQNGTFVAVNDQDQDITLTGDVAALRTGATASQQSQLQFYGGASNADYVGISAPGNSLGSSYSLVLPSAQGGAGDVLTNDGSGNLSWAPAGGNAAGSNMDVQYNNNGAFGADTGIYTFNPSTTTLSVLGSSSGSSFVVTPSGSTPSGSTPNTLTASGSYTGTTTVDADGDSKSYIGDIHIHYTNLQNGNFDFGTLVGSTSGATGTIDEDDDTSEIWLSNVSGTFQPGETITVSGFGGHGHSVTATVGTVNTVTTDHFNWNDGTSNGEADMSSSNQTLPNGLTISFSQTTGYGTLDRWTVVGSGVSATGTVLTDTLKLDNGSNSLSLIAPATGGSDYSLIFPNAQGAAGQTLVNDGSGNLSWTTLTQNIDIDSNDNIYSGTIGASPSTFTGSIALGLNVTNTASNQFYLADSITNFNLAGVNYNFPTSQARAAGDILTDNGSGNLSWETPDVQFVGGSNLISTSATDASPGMQNIMLGYLAGSGIVSSNGVNESVFIGEHAGADATNVQNSTFVGAGTGDGATNAGDSAFFGAGAGSGATNAAVSTFIGDDAGGGSINAAYSVFIGQGAGALAATAQNSIFIGVDAGVYDTVNNNYNVNNGSTGSSILIGTGTSTGGYSDSIAIGSGFGTGGGMGATNTASNQLMIGSSYSAAARINTLVFNGGTGNTCIIVTSSGISCSSDERLKTNITDLSTDTLDILDKVRTVTFNWLPSVDPTDQSTHIGFLAQDIEQYYPQVVSTNKDGMLAVNYPEMTPVLVEADRELSLKLANIQAVAAGVDPTFLNNLRSWLASAANGITDIYAKTFHADEVDVKKICVSDDSGAKTCITKSQLDGLLGTSPQGGSSGSAGPSVPVIPSGSSPSASSSTTSGTSSGSDSGTSSDAGTGASGSATGTDASVPAASVIPPAAPDPATTAPSSDPTAPADPAPSATPDPSSATPAAVTPGPTTASDPSTDPAASPVPAAPVTPPSSPDPSPAPVATQ